MNCRFFVFLFFVASIAVNQSGAREPHLAYGYPAGCQRGTECEIVIGGQHLKDAKDIYLAGEGVEIEILDWYRPMTQGEYTGLRRKMDEVKEAMMAKLEAEGKFGEPTFDEIVKQAGITEDQLKEMEIYRQRDRDPKRQPNDQLEEQVTVRIKVAGDAELGKRELRFLTDDAISNPLWLHIGRWHEVRETEPNNNEPDQAIDSIPVVVNGQIMPGDVDRFVFDARKGQKIVIEAGARAVIPFLADAVPGWFQAIMKLTDSSGRELSYADSMYYRQDPVMYFEVPKDDRYVFEIRDTLYRGREDFVYRVTVGEIPFVTSIYPLGGRVDSEVNVTLNGWNLTQTQVPVKTMSRKKYRPTMLCESEQGSGVSVKFPVQVNYWPEVFDEEPNNDYATAQPISTRVTINGHIDYPGDEDVYKINGGGRLIMEVEARRLGSPMDSSLRVTDDTGKELGFNDDFKDLSQALQTHHADSHLSVTVPGTGNHYLHVTDSQNSGGKDFSYRLTMRAPDSDYELRVTPASIIARAGAVVPITVFALRKDGFDQPIHLRLVDPPAGFQLDGNVIPGDADSIRMTLKIPRKQADDASGQPIAMEMEGVSMPARRSRARDQIIRPAVPAENMMQAFIWYHLVTVEKWNVVISGRARSAMPFSAIMPAPRVVLPQTGEFYVGLNLTDKKLKADDLGLEISAGPPGVSAEFFQAPNGAMAIKFTMEEKEIEPGLEGNLIISVYKDVMPKPTEENPEPKEYRVDYGYMPAIPFGIAEKKPRR
ncbi:peptidase [Planctomycetes bacterium CA13]